MKITDLLGKLFVVEREVVVQDLELIVFPPVWIEQELGQEREVLCIPDIHRVARAERDPSRRMTPSQLAAKNEVRVICAHMQIPQPA